jgi:Autotransporter beta-domain
MRKFMLAALAAVAFAVPSLSNAQVQLGLRAAYAAGLGDYAKDAAMSDSPVKSLIPLQLDVGYKVLPNLTIGGFASYGFGQTGGEFDDICSASGVDCSKSVIRVGVQGTYAFAPLGNGFTPWAGAGIAWERAAYKAEAGADSLEFNATGFEFLNLQVGGDWKVAEKFSVGPYLSLSFNQFRNAEVKDTTGTFTNGDGEISDKGIHEWLQFGVRGTFDL